MSLIVGLYLLCDYGMNISFLEASRYLYQYGSRQDCPQTRNVMEGRKEGRKAGYPTTSWRLCSSISSTGSSSSSTSSTSSTSIGWLGCLAHLLVHRVANLDIFICRSCPRKRPCLWYLPSQFVGQSMQKKDGTVLQTCTFSIVGLPTTMSCLWYLPSQC